MTFRFTLIFLVFIDFIYILRDYVYSINNNQTLAWSLNFVSNSIDVFLWLPIIFVLVFFLKRYPIKKDSLNSSLPRIFLIIFFLAFLHRFIAVVGGKYFEVSFGIISTENFERVRLYYTAIIAGGTLNDMIFLAIVAFVYTFISYYKSFVEEKEQKLIMAEELSKAQLEALRNKIQPHFLFNTLNTVSALMEDSVEKAQSVLSKLADFLRKALEFQEQKFVTLKSELKVIRSYLEIEELRFAERLSITYEIESSCQNAQVPSFILQPFVENSIKHGLNKDSSVSEIFIRAKKHDCILELRIGNNSSKASLKEVIMGIGLSNTSSRLTTIYKDNYSLTFKNDKGFENVLRLPFEELNESD